MTTRPKLKWAIEAGFTPIWTPAPDLKRWPPLGYRSEQKARLGLDWLSLAHMNLMLDPWDLIYFNFRTTDPREVNWYMRHYIGCWAAGPDRKNFQFTDYDDPGKIYIPPLGYKRATRMPYHGRAVAQLELALTHYPMLAWNNFSVGTETYRKVLAAMRDGRIYCFHDPFARTPAHYHWTENKLSFRYAKLSGWTARNALVHEMTHAILDFKKYKMYNWKHEVMAYTAQALWACAVDHRRASAYVGNKAMDITDIWHNAFILAHYLRESKDRTKDRVMRIEHMDRFLPDYRDPSRRLNPVTNLSASIAHHPVYAESAWEDFRRDGVPDTD